MLSGHGGIPKDSTHKQIIIYMTFFASVLINNSIDAFFVQRLSIHELILYTIPIAGFILLFGVILLLHKFRFIAMFGVLYVMSIVSTAMTESGSMTFFLAAFTTLYGIRNGVFPKNIVGLLFLSFGLVNAFGFSIFLSRATDPTAFANDFLAYVATTLIFGYEFGFGNKKISGKLNSFTDQEVLYLNCLTIIPELTQDQIRDVFIENKMPISTRRLQKIGQNLRTKVGVQTNVGLMHKAHTDGLL